MKLGRALAWSAAALLFAVLLIGLGLGWLGGSDRGSAWLLSRVPGLVVDEPQGRLFGGPFAAERIVIVAGGRDVVVQRPSWQASHWRLAPHAGAWFGLALDGLNVERVAIGAAPPSPTPSVPLAAPRSLRLPLALSAPQSRIGSVTFEGQPVASDVVAGIELGAGAGAQHRLDALTLRTARASATGQWRIDADAPFALDVQLDARSHDGAALPWSAAAQARGPLARIALDVRLASADVAGARLDARAALAPFAAWPLAALDASLHELDLAALRDDAPRTRLSGQASIDSQGLDRPIGVRIALANGLAGRWNEQRLPVEALELDLVGRADQRDRLDVRRFDLRISGDGGRASGSGRWQGGELTLDIALQALRPDALDARAPALRLNGTLATRASGLPAPDGSRASGDSLQASARLALEGRLDAKRGEPVALSGGLELQRTGAAWQLQARELQLRAGAARLAGRAQAEQAGADAALRLSSEGQAQGFDPALWWRDAPSATLNGRWRVDVTAPSLERAVPRDAAQWLALRGQAQLTLADSVLAGVALQAQLDAQGQREPGWALDLQMRLADSRATLQGRLAPRADDDRWRAEVDAPALAALRPLLAALAPRSAADIAKNLDGAFDARLASSGRWPALRVEGQAQARALRAGPWSAGRVALQAQAGPRRDAPLSLKFDAEGAAHGLQRVDTLQATLDGTLAAHRVAVDASSPLRPPAWADAALGRAPASPGSRARLRAEGRWTAAGNAASPWAGSWQARVSELDARPRSGDAAPWLAARDLQLQLTLGADGRATQAQAAPGSVTLLGAAVSWRDARWQAATAGGGAQLQLDTQLQPLAVAPLLARWQPDTGFSGDLTLQGRAVVRSSDAGFAADVVLERAGGDLVLQQEGDVQPLGLTDLRIALAADQGTWHFTQAVAGAHMGVLAGAQSLRLDPRALWPAPETPMQGVLEWRVADLGAWGRFTPPGWRVGGQLHTSAAIGGRFGAPEIEGRMEGRNLAVRNLLDGADLRDGELLLSLRGDEARVERFTFKGGDGTLRLSGGARLGAEPRATLQLVAEHFRLLGRTDRRIVVSGRAELGLDAKSIALDGGFTIDEGLIDVSRADAPSLDADVRVHRNGAAPASEAAASAPAPSNARALPNAVRVALKLDLGRALKLRGRGIDTRLEGQLAITAPGGRLALDGTVSTVEGNYAAYGQKLGIERGVLRFAGEPANPRLDIVAVRPNLDVRVGVAIGGTAQLPRVRLFSEPEMSDYDKLSWLVLGRASDGLARTDTALLQRAALALLAGEGQGADAQLLGNLGIDEFSVRQSENGEVRDTVVTLGKQLSRRWFVGYERGVNSTTGTWQLIYRVAQRFTLRAQSGEDSSLDAIWTWRWN
jgi:translocation and assembly module TamB